jgi:Redoxin
VQPVATAAAAGTNLKGRLPGVDWSRNGRTLVLAISTQCHFCRESTPFYRKLQQEAGKNVKMVAVLPQPVAEAEQYLNGEGVHVDQVKQASLGTIGIHGTPTMLLVDGKGVVAKVWTGKLSEPEQEQVLSILRKG